MKLFLVLALAAVALASPQRHGSQPGGEAQLLRYENDNIGLGNYKYGFELSDGTRQEVEGELKNEGREDESIAVRGSYSWVGPDGVTYTVTYIADENGFQPEIQKARAGEAPPVIVIAQPPPAVIASLLG